MARVFVTHSLYTLASCHGRGRGELFLLYSLRAYVISHLHLVHCLVATFFVDSFPLLTFLFCVAHSLSMHPPCLLLSGTFFSLRKTFCGSYIFQSQRAHIRSILITFRTSCSLKCKGVFKPREGEPEVRVVWRRFFVKLYSFRKTMLSRTPVPFAAISIVSCAGSAFRRNSSYK